MPERAAEAAATEETGEYATLKALGYGAGHVAGLIAAESMLIALGAGLIATWLIHPMAAWIGARYGSIFPIFVVADRTIALAAAMAALVGAVAAVVPAWRAATLKVSDGFRALG